MAGKRRSSKSARRRATGARPRPITPEESSGRPWWKGPVAWVATLVTAVVTGVAVALATTYSQHEVSAGQPKGPPVVVEHVAALPGKGQSFVFPQPLVLSRAQLMAFDSTAAGHNPGWDARNQDYSWAWKHGGAAADGVIITLDVQGNRKTAVRIKYMSLVEQCRSPATGTLFFEPGGGQTANIQMGFDLDQMYPIAQSMDTGKPYFLKNTITLAYGEQQEIQLDASTREHYCEFRIDMSVLDPTNNNEIFHEMISNGSQPFRVAAVRYDPKTVRPKWAAYHRLYLAGIFSWCQGNWVQANPLTYPRPNPGQC